MNKKLGRLLYSHVWIYFVIMAAFAVATFVRRQYVLAGVEVAVTVGAVLIYVLHKRSRNWQIQQFLGKLTDEQNGAHGGESPFPQRWSGCRMGRSCMPTKHFAPLPASLPA